MNKINTPTSQPNDDKTELTSDFTKTPAFGDFQNKFDVLVHTIPDGLILLKDEQIKYSNKNFADMLGYSINEITELGLREVIARTILKEFWKEVKKTPR